MQPIKRLTHSFIVRLWAEDITRGDEPWTGQVERVSSGEKVHFRGAQGLLKVLERWTPQSESSNGAISKEEL